jgi:hypothetical protein
LLKNSRFGKFATFYHWGWRSKRFLFKDLISIFLMHNLLALLISKILIIM